MAAPQPQQTANEIGGNFRAEGGVGALLRRSGKFAKRHLGFIAQLLIFAFAVGIAYRQLFDPVDQRQFGHYLRSGFHAVTLAIAGCAVHMAFSSAAHSRLGLALRRLSVARELIVRVLTMTIVLIIVAIAFQLALYARVEAPWLWTHLPVIVAVAFALSFFIGVSFEIRRLIGARVLGSFILGTYHRPQREWRIVMFLDLANSTMLAEKMGEIRVHDLITRFFFDIDRPIADHGGEIHAYIGDQVVVSWALSNDSVRNAESLRCFFAIKDKMERLAGVYQRDFGVVARFRAGLHAGPVVISECGDTKRQLAYFGDTMNVTARLEEYCKTIEAALVVSGELLRNIEMPVGLGISDRGDIVLRGRERPLDASVVHPKMGFL